MQILAIIVVLVLAAAGAFWYSHTSPSQTPEPVVQPVAESTTAPVAATAPASEPATTPEPSTTAQESAYKDGTYTATGEYNSPAGPEHVTVSLTVQNQVVTDATVKGDATNPKSIQFQQLFSEGYSADVVGKPLDAISLTVVNGSSLTPKGFMQAVAEIKQEAQA